MTGADWRANEGVGAATHLLWLGRRRGLNMSKSSVAAGQESENRSGTFWRIARLPSLANAPTKRD
jgi:hypothetical protein